MIFANKLTILGNRTVVLAHRNRWFLLSLTLQIVAGALVLAIAFGHGVPFLSALLPVVLLIASITLAGSAWQSMTTRREAQLEALHRYIRQRAEAPQTTPPELTDARMRELVQAVAALSVTDATPAERGPGSETVRNHALVHTLNQELRTPINASGLPLASVMR